MPFRYSMKGFNTLESKIQTEEVVVENDTLPRAVYTKQSKSIDITLYFVPRVNVEIAHTKKNRSVTHYECYTLNGEIQSDSFGRLHAGTVGG